MHTMKGMNWVQLSKYTELQNRYGGLEEKLRRKQEELDRAREAIQVIQRDKREAWTGSCLPEDLKKWGKE